MKKLIVLASASLILLSSASFAQDYRKEFKAEFMSTCMESHDPETGVAAADFKAYCACSADVILETLTEDEIIELGENIQANEGLLMDIIQPCLDELQAKYE